MPTLTCEVCGSYLEENDDETGLIGRMIATCTVEEVGARR